MPATQMECDEFGSAHQPDRHIDLLLQDFDGINMVVARTLRWALANNRPDVAERYGVPDALAQRLRTTDDAIVIAMVSVGAALWAPKFSVEETKQLRHLLDGHGESVPFPSLDQDFKPRAIVLARAYLEAVRAAAWARVPGFAVLATGLPAPLLESIAKTPRFQVEKCIPVLTAASWRLRLAPTSLALFTRALSTGAAADFDAFGAAAMTQWSTAASGNGGCYA
ncbi:MAG: hypothetical protein ACYDHY_15205 [Acidiferrobacterales bacterium]